VKDAEIRCDRLEVPKLPTPGKAIPDTKTHENTGTGNSPNRYTGKGITALVRNVEVFFMFIFTEKKELTLE
jgi:hypothetical protein